MMGGAEGTGFVTSNRSIGVTVQGCVSRAVLGRTLRRSPHRIGCFFKDCRWLHGDFWCLTLADSCA